MWNLYNVTTNQEAIRQFTKAIIDSIGNLEPTVWGQSFETLRPVVK